MSLIAGIYSLGNELRVNSSDIDIILDEFDKKDVAVESYNAGTFFLAKADIGAFQDSSFLKETNNVIAALAGDPILNPPNNIGRSRNDVLKDLSESFMNGDFSILRDCQGVYNICWYNSKTRLIILTADKLGVRPLYYYIGDRYLYFSGNMGVLEKIDAVKKCMDFVGVTERLILGSFLGRRTPYADIKVLRGGEYLKAGNSAPTIHSYFKWDEINASKSEIDELLDQAYYEFNNAVSVRAWRDESAFSFLSGGMDSRALVTSLWGMGKKLYCGNISFPNSQDAVYPKEFAANLGIKYFAFERRVDEKFKKNRIQGMMSKLIDQVVNEEDNPPRYPRLIFSGEGGSVGLGHVYMNESIVSKMRNGDTSSLVTDIMRKKYISKRLLRPNFISSVKESIHDDLLKEISSVQSFDPARSYYIFLLNTDQRCHMFEHYEAILEHRLEFLTPFYDGNFLALIISSPVDVCLYHNFYTQLFDKFPQEIKSVPWQTYPGHVPCPIRDERELSYQWSKNEGNSKFYSREYYELCKKNIFQKDFPKEIVNRKYIILSLLLHRLNLNDYSSEFKQCSIYYRYYSNSCGKVVQ